MLMMLAGCASAPNAPGFFTGPTPLHDSVTIQVELVDSLPGNLAGQATWTDNFCIVKILRRTYPRCLQHENRHCFEGAYHGTRPRPRPA